MNAPVSSPTATAKKAHLWDRDELDWYVEPTVATDALLKVERFVGAIWDPACGQGNIVKTAARWNYAVYGTDVQSRGLTFVEGYRGEHDFLGVGLPQSVCFALPPNIVCNPPFFRAVGAEAFIRKALSLATGKVAMFVDVRFLAGAKRANGLFAELAPSRVYIITPRVSCPPGTYLLTGATAGNGTSDWCWVVWDLGAPRGETRLIWLRENGETSCPAV